MSDELVTGEYLRLHQFLPQSRANGPGMRAVVWVQGCTLGCPGCFNAPTHPAKGGELAKVDELVAQIIGLGASIEGITISGGEPLQQQAGVANLLRQLKAKTSLSVILFTGFSWEELTQMGQKAQARVAIEQKATSFPLALLEDVDVLIAGRYLAVQHLARDLRGSANKLTYFLTDRYTESEMQLIPPAEVVITPEGEIIMSGIDPVKW